MPEEPEFDLEAVYDAEVAPLMGQIVAVCKAHGMPMFATFLYRHGGDGAADFRTVTSPPADFCKATLPHGGWQHNAIVAAYRAIHGGQEPTAGTVTRAPADA